MGKLIDICGEPIDIDKIQGFHLYSRDYIYSPFYEETADTRPALFRRFSSTEKRFVFRRMMPLGCVLGEREKPSLSGHEIKSFGEAAGKYALQAIGDAFSNVGHMAADLFHIDLSSNVRYNVMTPGHRMTEVRLRDIPAKVRFLSGKLSDVYKNDQIYEFLGEPIAPAFTRVKTLVLNVEKKTLVFFGNGIDTDDPDAIYKALIDQHNAAEELKTQKKPRPSLPKIEFPRIDIGSIKLQMPFVIKKEKKVDEEKTDGTDF